MANYTNNILEESPSITYGHTAAIPHYLNGNNNVGLATILISEMPINAAQQVLHRSSLSETFLTWMIAKAVCMIDVSVPFL